MLTAGRDPSLCFRASERLCQLVVVVGEWVGGGRKGAHAGLLVTSPPPPSAAEHQLARPGLLPGGGGCLVLGPPCQQPIRRLGGVTISDSSAAELHRVYVAPSELRLLLDSYTD